MIYRVHYIDDADGSRGYAYATTKRAADRLLATWRKDSPETRVRMADIEAAPTPTTKAACLALLRRWAAHADNG